jgi:ketosteroid isomerase-like protein
MATDAPGRDDITKQHADAILDRLLAALVAHDMDGFADCFAPSGSIEFPFASPGYPERIDGRDDIRSYMSRYPEIVDVREVVAQRRLHTEQAGTVVVEFELGGVGVANQRPYTLKYVAVITVGGEGIEDYRDYWSPAAAEEALSAPAGDLGEILLGGNS